MRTAQNDNFTLNLGIGAYKQSYRFSVDGSAGATMPDIIITHQPYQGTQSFTPPPQTTHVRFDGNAYIPDNKQMIQAMPSIAHASYLSYVTGIAEGAGFSKIALEQERGISNEPWFGYDAKPTGNYVSIDDRQTGHWEVQGLASRDGTFRLGARIISPQGVDIYVAMGRDGKPSFSAPDSKSFQMSIPHVVHHAAHAMVSAHGTGMGHARDNFLERERPSLRPVTPKADMPKSSPRRVVEGRNQAQHGTSWRGKVAEPSAADEQGHSR